MTKKKNIFVKLFVVLVALTLISCCFLGSTFARYTSGGDGSATVTVAKWSIDVTGGSVSDGSITLAMDNLSPSDDEYSSSGVRSHTSAKVHVATIKNSGAVDALVTLSASATPTVTYVSGDNYDGQTGQTDAGITSEANITDRFTIAWFVGTAEDDTDTTAAFSAEGESVAAKGGTLYIFAQVTWTSADTSNQNGDAIDTWIGENVSTINWTLSYTAVQASELPTA